MSDARRDSRETRGTAKLPPSVGSDTSIVTIPWREESTYRQFEADQNLGNIQYAADEMPGSGNCNIQLSLGYRRCYDFDPTNGRGQDYAVVRISRDFVVGVVADGVSQSFLGDIAARCVSGFLIDELWNAQKNLPSPEALEQALQHLEPQVAVEVNQYRLSQNLPEMQLSALERARSRGSQTVFAAFALDLNSRKLALYQVGDVEAIVKVTEGIVPYAGDHSARWSSAGNSRLLVKRHPSLSRCGGVLLKSDGAGERWGNTPTFGSFSPEAFAQLVSNQAPKDDVAFVSVYFDDGSSRAPSAQNEAHVMNSAELEPLQTEIPGRGKLIDVEARTSNAGASKRLTPGSGSAAKRSVEKIQEFRPVDSALTRKKSGIEPWSFFLGLTVGVVLGIVGVAFLTAGTSEQKPSAAIPPKRASLTEQKSLPPGATQDLPIAVEKIDEWPAGCADAAFDLGVSLTPTMDTAILCLVLTKKVDLDLTARNGTSPPAFYPVSLRPLANNFYAVMSISATQLTEVQLETRDMGTLKRGKFTVQGNTAYLIYVG
jgi:hypothetical protein